MNEQQVNIKMDDQVAKGSYVNNLLVSHTKDEFIMDFISLFAPQGSVVARIFTTPGHMKRINNALTENIENYEKQFGKIDESDLPEQKIGFKK
ncbi:MAG: DUF3467 domain-containing protein [Patescibacteria group bacterium]|jgi:hypothetical protein|nr:DUF3467 domain-containing protein [Patescibacteria group bacterium]